MAILIRNARVVTLAGGDRPRRGRALGDLGVIASADVRIAGERIVSVTNTDGTAAGGNDRAPPPRPAGAEQVIDARGRVLMPAFIDCHTHACWAGDRLDEWEMRRRGAPYLDILKTGGGIMSTVRAVREASEEQLAEGLLARLAVMLAHGTTTVEVKSGYGLSTADELKMLRAIKRAADRWAGTVVPTALLGHAIDADAAGGPEAFIRRTIEETLPAISAEFPGIAVDAYCESGAWSVGDCVRLFERAVELGHTVRVHADQFTSMGMVGEAVRLDAVSVDHLEASTPEDLRRLAGSGTMGVALPGCGFHVDGRYADGRAFVDAGGAIAVATNLNPGSSPCGSMPMAAALAVRGCGLTPSEAIAACTVNAAAVLGLSDRGAIAPGQRADLVLLRHMDERMLAYEFGGNPVDMTVCGGTVVN